MTGVGECGDMRQALGVYVLGAIDPAERALVDRHLANCPDCREELAGLAGLPALLGKVPAAEVHRMSMSMADADAEQLADEAPDTVLRSLLGHTARQRRQRRWRGLIAAAAAVLIAVGGGVAAERALQPAAHSPVAQAHVLSAWAQNPRTHVAAAVRYIPRSWGTQVAVKVSGIPDGTTCQFVVLSAGGRRIATGGWTVTYGQERTWYQASSSSPASSVRGFQITAGKKVLVTVPVQ